MDNELDQLTKAINLGQQAVEVLNKSHVKEYTRTTASGTSIQVKEHEDMRQAAEEATKAADKHQAGMDWGKPDTKKLQELHHYAAKKHIDAMEAAHQAGDGESMHHHFYKASMHLGAAGSAGTFHRKDASDNAKTQTSMADHISAIAVKHKGEKTSHNLDHGSSIHLLAMEQHQRASAAHSAHHNSVYGTPEADEANSKAEGHQVSVREHGKSVQHFSGIAIKASEHAYNIGKAADKSKNHEDHKEAATLHRHAASLDYDSEGRAEHEAKAAEHDKKAKNPFRHHEVEPEDYDKVKDKVIITDVGSENIYFRHEGKDHFVKHNDKETETARAKMGEVDGITPGKANMYKTAVMKKTGEHVGLKAAGHLMKNPDTGRDEHAFHVTGTDGESRGKLPQSELHHFVL